MGNETMNAENAEVQGTAAGTSGAEEQAKTFTQEDVNRIVQERLARERERLNEMINDDEGIRKELAAERLKVTATKEISQRGYPVELVELLDCSTEQTYKESLEKLDKMYDMIYDKIVSEVFKSSGRNPRGGSDGSAGAEKDRLRGAFGLG